MRALLPLAALAALACRGPAGAAGAPGSAGAPGLAGWELVEQRVTIQPSTGQAARIQCPAGKKVLSGGWAGAKETLQVSSSRAIRPDTWEVWFMNSFGMTQEVVVSVVCASVAGGAPPGR